MQEINNRLDKAKNRFSELKDGAEENIQNVEREKLKSMEQRIRDMEPTGESPRYMLLEPQQERERERMGQMPYLRDNGYEFFKIYERH